MTIDEAKQAMRAQAIARRVRFATDTPNAPRLTAENFLMHVPLRPGSVVSAYFAIGEEADPALLIEALRVRGHRIALPRVVGKGKPLAFHLWDAGAALAPGPFGLSQPAVDWPVVDPDVLAVPLLAFDKEGNRLGYGAGFYDRTLMGLRARKKTLATGFAFSVQEFEQVPHHEGDERLDMIVTEKAVGRFTKHPG